MSATERQITRAFGLADRWASSMIAGNCVPIDPPGTEWSFADEKGCEVPRFDDAPFAVREAVSWLIERGYGSLEHDDKGEFLRISKELP